MQFRPVLSKSDFVRRYLTNSEFGNGSPSWANPAQFMAESAENQPGLFHLRNRVAGGVTHYNTYGTDVLPLWYSKSNPADWYCSEMVPANVGRTLLLQGEVMESERGLYLYYSQVQKPMRDSLLAGGQHVYGLTALGLLKRSLCPNSYEWLTVLLDRYPGHVVEFSSYSKQWGSLYPDYNTVFWEVRKY